jgi:hypothetical protein
MAKRRKGAVSNSTIPNGTAQSTRRRSEHPRDPPSAVSNGTPLAPKQINARPHLENAESAKQLNGGFGRHSALAIAGGVVQSTVPAWIQSCMMVGLIFGGCCSNVRLNHPAWVAMTKRQE